MNRWITTQHQTQEMQGNGHELTDEQRLDLSYYEYSVSGYRSERIGSDRDTLCSDEEATRSSLDALI